MKTGGRDAIIMLTVRGLVVGAIVLFASAMLSVVRPRPASGQAVAADEPRGQDAECHALRLDPPFLAARGDRPSESHVPMPQRPPRPPRSTRIAPDGTEGLGLPL
jgi:hypothetical protein